MGVPMTGCTSNADCFPTLTCCPAGGCARSCVREVPLERCPPHNMSPEWCASMGVPMTGTCTSDDQCGPYQRCCSAGCTRTCMDRPLIGGSQAVQDLDSGIPPETNVDKTPVWAISLFVVIALVFVGLVVVIVQLVMIYKRQ